MIKSRKIKKKKEGKGEKIKNREIKIFRENMRGENCTRSYQHLYSQLLELFSTQCVNIDAFNIVIVRVFII